MSEETSLFPKILAIQAIVQEAQGRVLLKKREKEPDQGKWELVAGYVKPGERLVETVQRKIFEELNIKSVQNIEFTGQYYDDPNRHPGTNCIPLVFAVKINSHDVSISEEVKWFNQGEIENLEIALDNKQSLQDFFTLHP